MTAVVVDTDVVSLIFKRHFLAEKYLDSVEGQSPVLSFHDPGRARLVSGPPILGSGSANRRRNDDFLV